MLYEKPEFLPIKYGIAVIIRKQILKERHKLVFILFGMIMTRIKTTKIVAMNTYHSVNIYIFTNGMK